MTETIENIRAQLLDYYNKFVAKFGRLNRGKNRNLILQDAYGYSIMSSLEVKIGTNDYRESDILHRSNKSTAEVYEGNSAIDALSYCLGTKGCVDLQFISDLIDREKEELLLELGDLIYKNPATGEYETADKYLSGNVYRKLLEAEAACRDNPSEEHTRSYQAIKEIQVPYIPFELLDDSLNLGERWFPVEKYQQFASWLFECNVLVNYFKSTDVYKVTCNELWSSAKISREYRVEGKGRTTLYGHDLMEYGLLNTTPYIQYGTPPVPDNDAIQLANQKIEEIRQKFTEWIWQLPAEDKDMLVELYNNTYNCYVIRKYDGSHMRLPDIDMERLKIEFNIDEIRPAQKDGAWRIIQDNGAIMDWSVGAGKTLVMIIAAHEMKRMKIRNKPCILCLKANVQDVVKTYRCAYPNAKILAPGEHDFEKKNRVRLFHEMKNNDWDCVIMTHDQFGRIPQSNKIQLEILQDEIGNLDRDLDSLHDTGWQVSRSMRKGLENRKAGLTVKLKQIQNRIEKQKDQDVDFEQMNIDHLLCDESHRYKNLCFTSRHDRVAGLGNMVGSQKALNMLFAIRTLQKRLNGDLQATFLSGTPISNSLTEMYLLFKYLRPNELARQNILNFDAWAAVYAKKTTDFEFSVTNQIIAKERFRHFIKVPELALFYNEIADYRTNKSINIDKPELVEELVNLKPSEDQKEFIRKLIKYAETGEGHYIGRYDLAPGLPTDTARMLIATNYAKKMSTDMRLINADKYEDHPGNKISVCCEKLVEYYRKFDEQKGVQLVFCDLGVPDDHKWNVYQAILDKLVEEYLIPDNEIAFIHDYNERTRQKLFKQVNDGVVRILLGSTDKAGTGVNIQQRVVVVHDLDIPWKPAELEQRGGRGARQGNWLAKLQQNNVVYRFIYATEQSLDTYKFTLLKNKQTFISQMKTNELQVRSIDEGSFDEGTGMNFAEYVAILSGDNTLLEKAKIDKKLAVLENLKTVHYREQHNNKYLLEHKINRLAEVNEITETLVRDNEQYERLMTRAEDGTKNNPIIIYELTELRKQLQEQRDIQTAERNRIKEEKKAKREAEKLQATWNKLNAKATKRAIQEGYITESELIEEPADVPEVEEIEVEEVIPLKDQIKDDATVVGEWLINLFKSWHPRPGEHCEVIGELLGFKLYIERCTTSDAELISSRAYQGSNQIMFTNKLYSQHSNGGLHYTFNHGVPSSLNARLASRNHISGLDRIGTLLVQYTDEKQRLEQDVSNLKRLDIKPFAKEDELLTLKQDSKRLEKQIENAIREINTATTVAEVTDAEYEEVNNIKVEI